MAVWCDDQFGCDGILTIDTVDMNCPAWDIPLLNKLWFAHAVAGESFPMAGLTGQRSNPQKLDQATYDLLLLVNGGCDPDGNEYTDPWSGLFANLQLLWDSVLTPVESGRGVRQASLTVPSITTPTYVAEVQTFPLQAVGDEVTDPNRAEFTFTLVVPGGRFVPAP